MQIYEDSVGLLNRNKDNDFEIFLQELFSISFLKKLFKGVPSRFNVRESRLNKFGCESLIDRHESFFNRFILLRHRQKKPPTHCPSKN